MIFESIFALYSIVFIGCFWSLLIWRLLIMRRSGIDVLKISGFGFFSLLVLWSVLFILLSIEMLDFPPLKDFWIIYEFPLSMILLFFLGAVFQIIMWFGIFQMGKSWRIGIDDDDPGDLITEGIFQISRNPIFFGLDGILIVVFFLHPNLFFLVFTISFIIGIHIQILREENHLLKIYGQEYKEYKKKTSRYFLFF
ncbi:MAG: conserved membrane protein of unknown function [Promethearchaeota archaeon]|nr:MAG: conserved membrane protein of unknown function [Candidatus Lokiarchaeota archaeon]